MLVRRRSADSAPAPFVDALSTRRLACLCHVSYVTHAVSIHHVQVWRAEQPWP